MVDRFGFDFDPRFRLPLAALGVVPSTCEVVVTDHHFDARFGALRLQTTRDNLRGACITGPYNPIKVIGPRRSMADGGATFGTNARRGVCITFHDPVGALFGRHLLRHPGLTVTIDEPDRLLEVLGLGPC